MCCESAACGELWLGEPDGGEPENVGGRQSPLVTCYFWLVLPIDCSVFRPKIFLLTRDGDETKVR